MAAILLEASAECEETRTFARASRQVGRDVLAHMKSFRARHEKDGVPTLLRIIEQAASSGTGRIRSRGPNRPEWPKADRPVPAQGEQKRAVSSRTGLLRGSEALERLELSAVIRRDAIICDVNHIGLGGPDG